MQRVESREISIPTQEFHGIKLYAFGPIALEDLIKMFANITKAIEVYSKERNRRMGILVRPEDKNGKVIEPNFAYTYPDEIFFSDASAAFRPRQGRAIIEYPGYTYAAIYDNATNSLRIFTDRTKTEANEFLDQLHIREAANISVI